MALPFLKTEEAESGALVISHDGRLMSRLLLVLALVFLATAVYDVTIGSRGTERLVGLLGAGGTCLGSALVFLETARFEFARATRTLTWRRRWGVRERSGSLHFSSIRAIETERPIGDDGTPSRRIVIKTINGEIIPVTHGYQADPADGAFVIVERIRSVVGLEKDEGRRQELTALVDEGRTTEAIKLLRETEGLSLTDAKKRVDEMKPRS